MNTKLFIKKKVINNFDYIPNVFLKKLPLTLGIETVAGCNLNCFLCPANKIRRNKGVMNFSVFKNIIDQFNNVSTLNLFFMGEPLLNKDIFKMIDYSADKTKVKISTNSSFLLNNYKKIVDSSLYSIKVSLDGFSQDTIDKYRKGADFHSIIDGIRLLCSYRDRTNSDLKIIVGVIAFNFILPDVDKIIEFANEVNADAVFINKPFIRGWSGYSMKELDAPNVEWDRNIISKNLDRCPMMFSPIITWDGFLLPCCQDVNAVYSMGNVLSDNFYDLFWDKFYDFRLKQLHRGFDICKTCDAVYREDIGKTIKLKVDGNDR